MPMIAIEWGRRGSPAGSVMAIAPVAPSAANPLAVQPALAARACRLDRRVFLFRGGFFVVETLCVGGEKVAGRANARHRHQRRERIDAQLQFELGDNSARSSEVKPKSSTSPLSIRGDCVDLRRLFLHNPAEHAENRFFHFIHGWSLRCDLVPARRGSGFSRNRKRNGRPVADALAAALGRRESEDTLCRSPRLNLTVSNA